MKKLIYNEITKEIDVVNIEDKEPNSEQEIELKVRIEQEKPENSSWRKFVERLEKNKVIFETVIMFAMTLVTIIVYIMGNSINNKTKEISEKQLEIAESDKEPNFTIKSEDVKGIFEAKDYYFQKKLHIVMNKGGLITGAYLSEIHNRLTIYISNKNSKETTKFDIQLIGLIEKTNKIISLYDEKDKVFRFYEYETDKTTELLSNLERAIREIFPKPEVISVSTSLEKSIDIEYINYKNKECHKTYQLLVGDRLIRESHEDTYDKSTFVGTVDINDDIGDSVRNIREKIKEKSGYTYIQTKPFVVETNRIKPPEKPRQIAEIL